MYEEHFELTRKPFQLSPDASFFFPSAEHRRALSFLQYGVSQGDGFIVITGNVGTGKTTLVQALLGQLDHEDLTVGTIVTSNLREDELLQMVASCFDIADPGQGKAQLIREIEHNFTQQAMAGKRILLIVDEAQNIPKRSVEELRMLSNFQLDGHPLLQIFLLGQQEFRGTLLSEGFEQLRQRVIATYHLNPLGDDETRTYIEHRLQIADWKENPAFTDDAFPAIYAFSEGVPRRINNLCDRLLLFAFLEEIETIDRGVVEKVSNEIGSEFVGSTTPEQAAASVGAADSGKPLAAEVFDTPEAPLETMARSMFDKANVQNRLAALERAVDGLGHHLKPELAVVREELSFLRLMMDDLLHEVREVSRERRNPSSKKKVS